MPALVEGIVPGCEHVSLLRGPQQRVKRERVGRPQHEGDAWRMLRCNFHDALEVVVGDSMHLLVPGFEVGVDDLLQVRYCSEPADAFLPTTRRS